MDHKVWWTMKDLEGVTGYKYDWLTTNILFRPEYKKILDIEKSNMGCVYYPHCRGDRWGFMASKMQVFLEAHFSEIFQREKIERSG
ncbi:MAG: DUF771 domain-containing protein [Sporolactobacillus sp.]